VVSCLNSILSFFTLARSIFSALGPSFNHIAISIGPSSLLWFPFAPFLSLPFFPPPPSEPL
jgi:hypothetical protein